MRARRSYFQEEVEKGSFWPSFTDMMSTIVLVMLFIALVAFVQSIYDAYEQQEIKKEMAKVASVKKHMADLIQQEIENEVGQDRVRQGPNNTISIEGDILFEPGSAQLSSRGRQILIPLADAFQHMIEMEDLSQYLYIILIEGHTDIVPDDNWALSTDRALAVLKYMKEVNPVLAQDEFARYFAATGYSEYHPVAEGTDADSLRQNRRISFQVIVDDETWQQQLYRLMDEQMPVLEQAQ